MEFKRLTLIFNPYRKLLVLLMYEQRIIRVKITLSISLFNMLFKIKSITEINY